MIRIFIFMVSMISIPDCSQNQTDKTAIRCGDEQTEIYLPMLHGKRVAVMANQTSIVGNRHLVDTLVSSGIDVKKIFSAEHGFRGNEADGILINDGKDLLTGLPIISLYGKNRKPTPDQLEDVDIVVFDIQDVGVRFYTFISSMHYLMEACADNGKEFLVLDRPNPNGNYIDGPIMEKGFESFIGMHPVPVVHGMTVAEYARMINGEGWLKDSIKCDLKWVPCKNYQHEDDYNPPTSPSPNLPNLQAIRLYPSLAFFEGTMVSEGRGTEFPFQVFGYPEYNNGNFEFTPESRKGASLNPKFENQLCKGQDLRGFVPQGGQWNAIHLEWLIETYTAATDKTKFFLPYFDKLAGTDRLRTDIQAGVSVEKIREKWKVDLIDFTKIRKKYLLYD
jgi:uncharacterized protein YbbC (DUF1343 family)